MLQMHQVFGGVPGSGAAPGRLGGQVEAITLAHLHGFALATRSPDITRVLEVLLKPETPWQHHQLALLLSDHGSAYDPRFLAEGSKVLLVGQPGIGAGRPSADAFETEYPPMHSGRLLWSDISERLR